MWAMERALLMEMDHVSTIVPRTPYNVGSTQVFQIDFIHPLPVEGGVVEKKLLHVVTKTRALDGAVIEKRLFYTGDDITVYRYRTPSPETYARLCAERAARAPVAVLTDDSERLREILPRRLVFKSNNTSEELLAAAALEAKDV